VAYLAPTSSSPRIVRDHRPATAGGRPVEAVDQQHVPAEREREPNRCDVQTCAARELHRQELALDDRVGVRGRAELRDQPTCAVAQQRLRPGTADRAAMQQRLVERRRERDTLLDPVGGLRELRERCVSRRPRDVFRRRGLEVQGADPVRAGLQQVGQEAEVYRVASAPADPAVQDHPLAPRVRGRVGDGAGHVADQW